MHQACVPLLFFALSQCAIPVPKLHVAAERCLVDERLSIQVSGLPAGTRFTLRAVTSDQRNRPWRASAEFLAESDGATDISKIAPLPGGSYEGADAMGLFWSAEPASDGAQIAHQPGFAYETNIYLEIDGAVQDSAKIERRFDGEGVRVSEIDEAGIVGRYYRPAGQAPFPGVVVIAGSDGGITSAAWRASLLASRGFAALALAVFRYEGRPEDLVELPIEYAEAAVAWLDSRPETGGIGILGFSKGSELALSVASRSTTVQAVVAISPSAYVWPGISNGPPETRSSWTLAGEPLLAIPWNVGPGAGAMFAAGPPFRLRLLYEESLEAAPDSVRQSATIPIAAGRARVLLVAGEDDGSWPASEMSRKIAGAMRAAGKADAVELLNYADAGHLLFWDYLPVTSAAANRGQIFGGTAAGTAAARADSWPRIQSFLRDALQ